MKSNASQSSRYEVHSNWQFGLRSVLLNIAAIALLLSLWKLGGIASVRSALVTGLLLGFPIAYLSKRRVVVVCAAVIGAILSTMLGLHFLGIDIQRFNDTSHTTKTQYEVKFLVRWQIVGTLFFAIYASLWSWLTKKNTEDTKTDEPLERR